LSKHPFIIKNGERIYQMKMEKYEKVKWEPVNMLVDTFIGERSFGHTGKE
jgi:dUTP pyrophosphatase